MCAWVPDRGDKQTSVQKEPGQLTGCRLAPIKNLSKLIITPFYSRTCCLEDHQ